MILKKLSLLSRRLRIIWTPQTVGRKPLDKVTINLILELKKLNPTWGAQKISDELAKIGYEVSKKTVLKYLNIFGLSTPPHKHLRWGEFIGSHKFKIGIDFTSLISITGHQLFIFVMIDLDTRELLYINPTYSPHLSWVSQQFKNAFFYHDHYPTLCICDNDSIFGRQFEKMLDRHFEIKLRRIPYNSPEKNWQDGEIPSIIKSRSIC